MSAINLEMAEYTQVNQIEHITIQTESLEKARLINEEWLTSRGDILVRIPCVDGLVVVLRKIGKGNAYAGDEPTKSAKPNNKCRW